MVIQEVRGTCYSCLQSPIGKACCARGEVALSLVKLEAVMGQGSGGVGRGLGRRSPIRPQAVLHVEAPVPGAFNMFVVKLSAKESQHSSQ